MTTNEFPPHSGPEGPQGELRTTLALAGELSEAMAIQLRRARRLVADPPHADIAPGVLEEFEETAESLHRKCVLLAAGGQVRPTLERGRPGSTGLRAVASLDSEGQKENVVRTLARDLKREGRRREDVVRTLAEDFGLENVDGVVSEVFGVG